MIEDVRQVSFDIDENNDCGNDEMSTFQSTQNSPEIHYTAGSIPVAVAAQSHSSISRINSSFILSNNPENLGLEPEECPAISKPPSPVCIKRGPMWNRKACVWASFIFFLLLVGVISLGLAVWSNRQEITRNSYRSTSESHSNSLPTQAPDISCQNRSTMGFLFELFTSGYDIMRTNPLHKKIYGKPLLAHALLRECRIKQDVHRCQPNVESVLIDSLASYHQWTRRFIAFPHAKEDHQQLNNSAITGAVASANDNDLLNIQTSLMSGNLIIMTHLNCPLVNTSRTRAPQIKPEFIQRLRITTNANMDDEEELKELVEDFGAHYVDQAILGTEVIIRFTLDRKVTSLFKRKNLSLVSQATVTGLYILSRTNVFINISKINQKLALEFIASAKTQIYSGSELSPPISELKTADHWVQLALKHFVVISVQVKPIDYLFAQIPQNNIPTIHEKWSQSRKQICSHILSLELNGKCQISSDKNSSKSLPQHQNEQRSAFVLPLLLIWTNRSTVCLRTSWKHCLELCRNDPLCSAATICVTSRTSTYQKSEGTTLAALCPPEFQTCDCALHRQQDFSYGMVSPKVVTLVPVRQDLRPVILRGFAVNGKPLILVKQIPDLSSCVRLCSRTAECKIVSFSQYDLGQHKICKLFSNMTDNELRRKEQATTLFIMATFSPCFSDDVELERSSCPTNANCSSIYGMCVCMPDFFKNGTACVSHNLHYRQNTRKVNEDVGSNNNFNKKSQHTVRLNDDQHRKNSFLSTISMRNNTSISSNVLILKAASSRPSPTDVDDNDGGPHSGELLTTTNKNLQQMSNIEKMSFSERISTTPMNNNPTKDTLKSIGSKSSYVPWQMKLWNKATL